MLNDYRLEENLFRYADRCSEYLNLRCMTVLRFKKKVTWGKEKYPCHGRYDWVSTNKLHRITVEVSKDIEVMRKTIRHELVHAWQSELDIKMSHGKVFKWWMDVLENEVKY